MTKSKDPKKEAVEKLAKAYGHWNCPGNADTRYKRNAKLYRAINKVITVFGAKAHYKKAIDAEFNKK